MSMYKGNVPDTSEGWSHIFRTENMYDSEWLAFVKYNDPEGRYVNVKIVSIEYVENKANYWLRYDKKLKNISNTGRDAVLIKAHRPELYETIKNLLKKIIDCSVFEYEESC